MSIPDAVAPLTHEAFRQRQKAAELDGLSLASGLPAGLFNKERLTPEFKTGIVAPYSDEEGKLSINRKPFVCGEYMIRGRRL
jgi:hypothetical protein